ncbi:uncharacterized [Tachysurus ichikawai]
MFHFCTSIGNASARSFSEDNVSSPAISISHKHPLSPPHAEGLLLPAAQPLISNQFLRVTPPLEPETN